MCITVNVSKGIQLTKGFGSSVMMVTSLALTADFIGGDIHSSGTFKVFENSS
jgi:hypothetical protein